MCILSTILLVVDKTFSYETSKRVSFNENYGVEDFKTAVQSHIIRGYDDRACFIKLVLWLWCGMSKGIPAKKHLLTSQDINIS